MQCVNECNMECKKPSCCCLMAISIVGILMIGTLAMVTFFNSDEPVITGGPDDIIDAHKSIFEQISLLSLSNQSGADSWKWVGLLVATMTILAAGYYVYHRKIKLPKRRAAREDARNRQIQDARQQEFILSLMNQPSPN